MEFPIFTLLKDMSYKSLNGARWAIVNNFTENMECSPNDIIEIIFGIKPLYPARRFVRTGGEDERGRPCGEDKPGYVCSIETLAIVVDTGDGIADYLFVGENQPLFDERIPLKHICYDNVPRRLPSNWEEDPENIIDKYYPEYKNADAFTQWDKIHEYYSTIDKVPFSTVFITNKNSHILNEIVTLKRKFVRFSTTATPKQFTTTEMVKTRKTPDRRRKDPWARKEVTKTIAYFPIKILKGKSRNNEYRRYTDEELYDIFRNE